MQMSMTRSNKAHKKTAKMERKPAAVQVPGFVWQPAQVAKRSTSQRVRPVRCPVCAQPGVISGGSDCRLFGLGESTYTGWASEIQMRRGSA